MYIVQSTIKLGFSKVFDDKQCEGVCNVLTSTDNLDIDKFSRSMIK